jgi:hypothetical protein
MKNNHENINYIRLRRIPNGRCVESNESLDTTVWMTVSLHRILRLQWCHSHHFDPYQIRRASKKKRNTPFDSRFRSSFQNLFILTMRKEIESFLKESTLMVSATVCLSEKEPISSALSRTLNMNKLDDSLD